jgi:hypothetical protein
MAERTGKQQDEGYRGQPGRRTVLKGLLVGLGAGILVQPNGGVLATAGGVKDKDHKQSAKKQRKKTNKKTNQTTTDSTTPPAKLGDGSVRFDSGGSGKKAE